ncbi:AraC family transcriptional regulator [Paenibacillus sp. MZ04-78.2]|uniref:ABC transporter substrate-binding protein n=1 Tax=Paenibacillus sp. MZ04-78.2 TaxID=2962034 RepID=UPI0020B742B6|nr:AraC family transcriptional regulator [Paenibacillus sp. MZ04-78.2]MCP3773795.1 AraC family transcriptional regulator [Paenibacillus sp. MZ04-78.2]
MLQKERRPREQTASARSRSSKKSLIEIREFMNEHYNEPLSIGQLAQMANITPKYFVDLFKKTYGQSAMDYLTDLRINRAKRYLMESEERLREIAQKVGYRDEFYFSRKFKKEVGVSPSDYVKKAKRQIAACSSSVTGQLLALNIMPAAAPLDAKWTPYYYNAYKERIKRPLKLTAPYTSWSFEENLGTLAQARPDAIIGTDRLGEDEKRKLEDIAPSFFVSTERDGWREQLRQIARFLEQEDKAEQWIAAYERRAELARARLGEALGDERILVLRIFGQGLHTYCNRGMEDVLCGDLKLKLIYREEPSGHRPLTMERLAELNPDRLLLLVYPEAASRAYWLALQHSAAWRQLKAVRNGQVRLISSDPWFEYSAVSVARMLDEAQLLFTGNCPNSLQDSVHGACFAP